MVSLDTAATAKLLKPPLRRQSPAQRHPSLGGSRLALHAQCALHLPPRDRGSDRAAVGLDWWVTGLRRLGLLPLVLRILSS